jgi:hypothetical protein
MASAKRTARIQQVVPDAESLSNTSRWVNWDKYYERRRLEAVNKETHSCAPCARAGATGTSRLSIGCLSAARESHAPRCRLLSAPASHTDDGGSLPRRNGYGMSTSPTLDQLRADIDSGRTGDKVAASDPAMASLGTDDEAAGTPPSSDAIALTQRLETSRPDEARAQTGLGHAWILVAFVGVFASALVCLGLFLKAF